MRTFAYHSFPAPEGAATLQAQVRAFVRDHLPATPPAKLANSWSVVDRPFSLALGAAGFIGMVWPRRYGGHARSPLERYIVLEELLAAGAPVGGHWVADRQTGPLLLRYGTEAQKQAFLPAAARGEITACIGLSEPGAGSDLAAVRTSARRSADGGWRISGQKLWTTNAHVAAYMLALVRTREGSERQQGLSQFLIDMSLPGVSVRPIANMAGEHDFNEVFLDEVAVPPGALVGAEGEGWTQVTAELALERSSPERYLSSHALFNRLVEAAGEHPPAPLRRLIGRLAAELWVLRQMSLSTAARLAAGENPALEAAMVKDLGNGFEQAMPLAVQAVLDEDLAAHAPLAETLDYLLQMAPSFSLRGGAREILRGMVARGLGLR